VAIVFLFIIFGAIFFGGKIIKTNKNIKHKREKELIKENRLKNYPKKLAVRAKRYTCECCNCFKKKKKFVQHPKNEKVPIINDSDAQKQKKK